VAERLVASQEGLTLMGLVKVIRGNGPTACNFAYGNPV
jgi:hypothetical protein